MEDYPVCSVDISLYFKLPVCSPPRVLRLEALTPVSKFEKIALLKPGRLFLSSKLNSNHETEEKLFAHFTIS